MKTTKFRISMRPQVLRALKRHIRHTRRVVMLNDQPVLASQHGYQYNHGHGFNSAPRLNWRISDDQAPA